MRPLRSNNIRKKMKFIKLGFYLRQLLLYDFIIKKIKKVYNLK
jgi:hypothetical protein